MHVGGWTNQSCCMIEHEFERGGADETKMENKLGELMNGSREKKQPKSIYIVKITQKHIRLYSGQLVGNQSTSSVYNQSRDTTRSTNRWMS